MCPTNVGHIFLSINRSQQNSQFIVPNSQLLENTSEELNFDRRGNPLWLPRLGIKMYSQLRR